MKSPSRGDWRALILCLTFCCANVIAGNDGSTGPTLGIICTFTEQRSEIASRLNDAESRVVAGREFVQGSHQDLNIIVTVSPMGLVSNAATAQMLVSEFGVDGMVSIGMAGGVGTDAIPGSLFYATEVVQHDKGTIEEYGHVWSPIPEDPVITFGWMKDGVGMVLDADGISSGTLVSGNQFIKSSKKREELRTRFNASAVDMQGSAIATVCYQNEIPVLLIRTISDSADANARMSFQKYAEQGGGSEAEIVLRLLDAWTTSSSENVTSSGESSRSR